MADRNQNVPEAQRRSPGRLSPLRQGVVLAPKKQVQKSGMKSQSTNSIVSRLKMPNRIPVKRISPGKQLLAAPKQVQTQTSPRRLMSPGKLAVRRLSPVRMSPSKVMSNKSEVASPRRVMSPVRFSPGKVSLASPRKISILKKNPNKLKKKIKSSMN